MRRAIGIAAAVAALVTLQSCAGPSDEASSAAPDDTVDTTDSGQADLPSLDAAADGAVVTGSRGPASVDGDGQPATDIPADPASGTTAQELIDCEVIGGLATRRDCDLYTQAERRAEEGLGAFNAPDPMYRGEQVMVQLAVSPATADDTAGAMTPETVVEQLPGRLVVFTPIVGRKMRAELTGVGFDIVPQSPKSQIVSDRAPTVWNWAVTANKAQRHTLTLTTGVEATGANGQTQVLIPTTKSITVNVKVTWWARIQESLEPIPPTIQAITAVLLALAALFAAFLGLRNTMRGKGTDTPNEPTG